MIIDIDCPRCGGSGCVAHDLNDDCDEDDGGPYDTARDTRRDDRDIHGL